MAVKFLSVLLLLLVPALAETDLSHNLVRGSYGDCLLVQDPRQPVDLAALVSFAIERGFYSIRISPGNWESSQPISIQESDTPILIRGDSPVNPPHLKTVVLLRNAANVTLEHLVMEKNIEIEQSDGVALKNLHFEGSGIRLKGKRCNQPNECTSYNRNIRIEDCLFEDSDSGIRAERFENSLIQNNRFSGKGNNNCNQASIGIELDGSSEDLDRPLEQGHNKGNRILQNFFDQEFAVGIRIRDSYANTIRDNQFRHSLRAIELLEGARYNQLLSSYIGSLSQTAVTSACPAACGIYLGPAAFDNILINNFFEQSFELQFLERNRNRTFLIDESGNRNTIRSDYPRLAQ